MRFGGLVWTHGELNGKAIFALELHGINVGTPAFDSDLAVRSSELSFA